MALRFYDGFDHYTSTDFLQKWTAFDGSLASFGTGRFGGSSIVLADDNVIKVLTAKATWIIGFAWKNTASTVHATFELCEFLNGVSTSQWGIGMNTSNQVVVYRNTVASVLATGTNAISLNAWHYFEAKVFISDTVGTAEVYVDGVQEINASSLDTLNSGTTADRFRFRDTTNSPVGTTTFDDIYACDTDGSAPHNDFLGDCRVEAIYPNGNGNSSQWVGQDANSTDNYQNVDETTPDDDTTYNESATVSNKDTYAYTNLSTSSGTVHAIQILPWARKTDSGTRTIVTIARHSGTEEDSASTALTTDYTYASQDIRTTKPGGGSWSISDVNGAEFGVKVNT